MADMSLLILVDKAKLSKDDTKLMLEKFKEYESLMAEWVKKDNEMVINDITETDKMAECAEALALVKTKYKEVETLRKNLGEESLRKKQAIDEIGRYFKKKLDVLINSLSDKANYAEIARQKALDELADKRLAEFEKYGAVVSREVAGTLSEAVFKEMLKTAKVAHLAEKKRLEEEAALAIEREQKLQKLAEIEKELEAERQRAAKLEKENIKLSAKEVVKTSGETPTLNKPKEGASTDIEQLYLFLSQLECIKLPNLSDKFKGLQDQISDFSIDLELMCDAVADILNTVEYE